MTRWAASDLVIAAMRGGDDALDPLIAAIWPRCYRLAATIVGDRSLAQDAAQETCAIVHRKVRGLRSADAFDAWIYRIVMNETARVRRRNPFVAEVPDAGHTPDGTTSLDVWAALASLRPELRDVTILFYFEDLRGEDIAAVLRVPHATVRTRLARAREALRGLLDDYRDAMLPASMEMKQHAL